MAVKKQYKPEIVIHTAWQIREIYGNRPLSYKWNIDGSDEIFDFCLENNFVERLVYFQLLLHTVLLLITVWTIDMLRLIRLERLIICMQKKRWTEEHLEKKR